MKPTIKWIPVLQPLYLRDYNSAVSTDDHFQVCVNPERSFIEERSQLLREYSDRFRAYSQLLKDGNLEAAKDFERWSEGEFMMRVNDWYARLLSFGEDTYTADELAEIGRVDMHLLNWLQSECVQMIEAHRSQRKKN